MRRLAAGFGLTLDNVNAYPPHTRAADYRFRFGGRFWTQAALDRAAYMDSDDPGHSGRHDDRAGPQRQPGQHGRARQGGRGPRSRGGRRHIRHRSGHHAARDRARDRRRPAKPRNPRHRDWYAVLAQGPEHGHLRGLAVLGREPVGIETLHAERGARRLDGDHLDRRRADDAALRRPRIDAGRSGPHGSGGRGHRVHRPPDVPARVPARVPVRVRLGGRRRAPPIKKSKTHSCRVVWDFR